MATITQPRSNMRELLREVIGPDVDKLTDASVGRVLGTIWATTRRELERDNPDQLELDA